MGVRRRSVGEVSQARVWVKFAQLKQNQLWMFKETGWMKHGNWCFLILFHVGALWGPYDSHDPSFKTKQRLLRMPIPLLSFSWLVQSPMDLWTAELQTQVRISGLDHFPLIFFNVTQFYLFLFCFFINF